MKQFIDSLGHQRYRLRTDNEPTIVKLAARLCKERPGGVRETAPRYSSQSLGGVGRFQRQLKEDVVTLRYAVERMLRAQ
eukprot:7874225-Alexandrium_andersonii.AAC.1